MHVRHCPACRTDYRPEIAVCADCGEPLVDRDDEQEVEEQLRGASAPGPTDLPPGFEPLFSSYGVYDLTPLADRLAAEAIDFRFREARRGERVVGYQILVHASEQRRARAVVGDLAGPGVFSAADSAEGAEAYSRCPACDTALSEGAADCPECGLEIAGPQPTCPRCGSPLEAGGAPQCSGCGLDLRGHE